jgi:hypothetical protein
LEDSRGHSIAKNGVFLLLGASIIIIITGAWDGSGILTGSGDKKEHQTFSEGVLLSFRNPSRPKYHGKEFIIGLSLG